MDARAGAESAMHQPHNRGRGYHADTPAQTPTGTQAQPHAQSRAHQQEQEKEQGQEKEQEQSQEQGQEQGQGQGQEQGQEQEQEQGVGHEQAEEELEEVVVEFAQGPLGLGFEYDHHTHRYRIISATLQAEELGVHVGDTLLQVGSEHSVEQLNHQSLRSLGTMLRTESRPMRVMFGRDLN